MASNSGTNKRQRTAADTLHINDLPIGFIVDVSAYLPKPSRAILAVAFTSSSLWQNNDLMHRLSPISTAIISASQWDILDFEDIDKELANKLTDDDFNALLKSISARDVLKRLKLCGCINITGIGLNPLRGSVVLEQIDLSLLKRYEEYRHYKRTDKVLISQEVVLPILENIIASDECSLKYIAFPHKWRTEQDSITSSAMEEFGRRYSDMFRSRMLNCTQCNVSMREHESWGGDGIYHNYICYDCLKPFCGECRSNSNEGRYYFLSYCETCNKDYCEDCEPFVECSSGDCYDGCRGCVEKYLAACDDCNEKFCKDEHLQTCNVCNKTRCSDCVRYLQCVGSRTRNDNQCGKAHCAECFDDKDNTVKQWVDTEFEFCIDCEPSGTEWSRRT